MSSFINLFIYKKKIAQDHMWHRIQMSLVLVSQLPKEGFPNFRLSYLGSAIFCIRSIINELFLKGFT